MKINFFVLAGLLAMLFGFSPKGFCADDLSGAALQQLTDINKKLDESKKREEQILAGQDKILEEILTSRKWAKRN